MKKLSKQEKLNKKIEFLENLGKQYSKKLIKNKTVWESDLCNKLSDLHYKFIFQKWVIVNKTKNPQLFILDFLLTDYNLIIECDGVSTHTSKQQIKNDNKRTKLLKKEGYEVLRLFNKQISFFTKEQIDRIIKLKLQSI